MRGLIATPDFLGEARDTGFYNQIIDLGKIRGGIM